MSKIFNDLELFILDLDGVVYEGSILIPGALDFLNKLREQNKIIFALTNNSTLTREKYYEKLKKFNLNIPIENIITSGYATAEYLSQINKNSATAFVIGEIGLMEELHKVNINPVNMLNNYDKLPEKVDYVVVGLDRNFNYEKLAKALTYLLRNAKFIATNNDPNLPTERGLLPGAGSMVSALMTCSGINPEIIIGKPNPFTINYILKLTKIPSDKAVIIGDRYTTDILAGLNAQIKTIMVLTGAGKIEKDIALKSDRKPHLIADSIRDLLKLI